jgi:hypothetical protein
MPDSDDAPIQESKSKLSKISDYLNHPIMIALVTFLLSGIVATGFTKWLDHLSQARELSTTLRTHATDSIKDITDIFYERMTRGALLASAIRRKVSEQDFTERERAYDRIYVKYDSMLQSQILIFNEFLNSQHTFLDINNDEISLNLPTRLFTLIDQCLTRAVDIYLSNSQDRRDQAPDILSKCVIDSGDMVFEGSEDAFRAALEAGKREIDNKCNLAAKT